VGIEESPCWEVKEGWIPEGGEERNGEWSSSVSVSALSTRQYVAKRGRKEKSTHRTLPCY
jgi:hypothetical protein